MKIFASRINIIRKYMESQCEVLLFWPDLHKLYLREKTGVFFGNFTEKCFTIFRIVLYL